MQLNLNRFKEIYSRYLASGLTVQVFCSNENFRRQSFYYWKKRMESSDDSFASTDSRTAFLPLTIDPPVDAPIQKMGVDNQLEITYPNGTTLRLLQGSMDVQEILTLLNLR